MAMNWKSWILIFVSTILLLFSGNALAQTDININNTNLIRLGGDVTVQEKQVVENAHAIGGSVTVQPNGRVTQTAIAIGGNVTLKKGARVDGDAYAIGGKVIQEEGATIGGATNTWTEDGRMGMHRDRNRFLPMYLFHASFRIFSAIVAAILGTILLRTAPSFLPNLATTVRQYPGQSALWGIGAIVALVALNIFLAVTLIGIPLIPLLALIVSLTSLVGALGIALFIGQQIVRDERRTRLQQFLIGLLMITVLALIPMLGGIVVFFVSLFGLGALLAWKLGKVQPPVMG
jgi:hypothetical protein